MKLFGKAILGSIIVVIIQLVSQTKNYYIAGLIHLSPTFALITHYIVGTEQTIEHLKKTIVFGILSLIPYLIYLFSLYYLLERFKLFNSLLIASLFWVISALLLIILWEKVHNG